MTPVNLAAASPSHLDLSSIAWVCVLGALTFACLRVRAKFDVVAASGRVSEMLAHVVIAYFSLGMLAFGASAAVTARFPVPGGSAWEGPVAVIGGLAAFTIGCCSAVEHALLVRARRRAESPVVAPVAAQYD